MWIEKRKNGYRAFDRYRDPYNNKLVRVSVLMRKDTPQERNKARKKLDQLIFEKTHSFSGHVTLSTLISFYEMEKKRILKASTFRRNMTEFGTFLKVLNNIEVDKLTAAYIKSKFTVFGNPTSYNEHLSRLKSLLRWGYQNEFIEDISYLDKLAPLPDTSKRQKVQDKFLEKEDCQSLIDAMDNKPWNMMTRFLLLSGCRIGEALALSENDISFSDGAIYITKTYDPNNKLITTPKTAASEDEIAMQDELADLCREIIEYNNSTIHLPYEDQPLFYDSTGKKAEYYAYRKYLAEISENVLGRKVTPHIFRHSHAALLAEAGKSYEFIQRRLRHENNARVTQEIYIHITNGLKEKDKSEMKEVRLL